MKYNIGDKVRVRSDLKTSTLYGMADVSRCLYASIDMLNLRGKDVTIDHMSDGAYRIKEDGYWWTDEMFEGKVIDKKIVITVDGAETIARLYEGKKVVKTATAKCSPDDTFDFETGARIAFDRLVPDSDKICFEPYAEVLKIEVGKKYLLKPYDKVKDHMGIRRDYWNKIAKRYVDVKRVGGSIYAETCYMGCWAFSPESFEKEYTEPQYYNGKVVCVKAVYPCFWTVGKVYEIKDGIITANDGSRRHDITKEKICHIGDEKNEFIEIVE